MENFSLNQKVALISLLRRRQQKKKRKCWIHPLLLTRKTEGKFVLLHEKLKQFPDKFFEYYRMSISSFNFLLSKIEDHIRKQNTSMRDCLCPEERLAITLRYLGTGCSIRSLYFDYLVGRITIKRIVKTTCDAIWEKLQPQFMAKPSSEEDWIKISRGFEKNSNFPHCCGAIDGKHIRIRKPSNTGSEFFNYKKFFSIVLMAVADSQLCFTYIDVGAYGSESDSNVFKKTELGKAVYSGTLNLPSPQPLVTNAPQIGYPFVFVADEAFACSTNLLRPYPGKNLTDQKKIFNYRLSRARRYVECAFGLLANKWRILHRPIDVDFPDELIKACCVLHNFVRKRDGYKFEDTLTCSLESVSTAAVTGTRGTVEGLSTRNAFTIYFNSEQGAVPWQKNMIS